VVRGVSVAGGSSEELVDGYDVDVDVAGSARWSTSRSVGWDETGGRHVVGLDGPGGDGRGARRCGVTIPGGEDVGGAAVLRAGESPSRCCPSLRWSSWAGWLSWLQLL
jgi:hypothetical protein